MIDWSKERANTNYCGYCTGSPPSANCDGSCFINGLDAKCDHLKREIEKVDYRASDLRVELKKINLMRKHKLKDDLIKVYDKKDAPEDAVFLCEVFERNGIIDTNVRSYDILKPNERVAYLFKKASK